MIIRPLTSDAIITTFTTLKLVAKGTKGARFVSRFAYIQLLITFDTLRYTLAPRRARRKIGRGDASAVLDIYLNVKGLALNNQRLRNRSSRQITIRRRWVERAGLLHFWLCLYLEIAETIMYVHLLYGLATSNN